MILKIGSIIIFFQNRRGVMIWKSGTKFLLGMKKGSSSLRGMSKRLAFQERYRFFCCQFLIFNMFQCNGYHNF